MTSGGAYRLDPRFASTLVGAAVLGAAGFVAGAFVAPERAWAGLLVGFHLVLGLGLAGAVFLSLLACSGAKWAAALRRVPEAMSAAIPVAAVAALVLLFGVPTLFEWAHASVVEHDPLLAEKSVYLNAPFLAARTVVAFALWTWLAAKVRSAAPGSTRIRWGAAFMAVFTVWFLYQTTFAIGAVCLYCLAIGTAVVLINASWWRVAAASGWLTDAGRFRTAAGRLVSGGSDLLLWGGLWVAVAAMMVIGFN